VHQAAGTGKVRSLVKSLNVTFVHYGTCRTCKTSQNTCIDMLFIIFLFFNQNYLHDVARLYESGGTDVLIVARLERATRTSC